MAIFNSTVALSWALCGKEIVEVSVETLYDNEISSITIKTDDGKKWTFSPTRYESLNVELSGD